MYAKQNAQLFLFELVSVKEEKIKEVIKERRKGYELCEL